MVLQLLIFMSRLEINTPSIVMMQDIECQTNTSKA